MLEKLICKFETKEKDKLNIYEIKERSFNMGSDLVNKTEKDFESIKHRDENGVEFWYARELMTMLEYSKWGNFKNVINKGDIND